VELREEYGSLLGYNAVRSDESQPTFRRSISIFRVEEYAEQETKVKAVGKQSNGDISQKVELLYIYTHIHIY
jgi:hypothetical protein